MQKQVVTRPGGTVKWTRDSAANDSDKTFTVPVGKEWMLKSVQASMVTTATVGNRSLRLDIGNGSALVRTLPSRDAVPASQSVSAQWAPGMPYSITVPMGRLDNGAAADNSLVSPLDGGMLLPAGYTVRVWDVAAVDAAADDLIVALNYIEYEA